MSYSDIENANSILIADPWKLISYFFPDAVIQGNEVCIRNPTRNDKNRGSCRFRLNDGKGADFATGQKWSDYVGLVAAMFFNENCFQAAFFILNEFPKRNVQTVNEKAAGRKLLTKKANDPNWLSLPSAPSDMDWPMFRKLPVLYPAYTPDKNVFYLEGRGIDENGNKISRPITPWRHKFTGKFAWRIKGPAKPYPLFNLDLLAENPEAAVIVVEGPKCVFAYQQYLDNIDQAYTNIVTSWPFGASSWNKADWRPIYGRKVTLWPDNDEPGRDAMKGVTSLLYKKCPSIKKVRVPENMPQGWDVADAIAEGALRG